MENRTTKMIANGLAVVVIAGFIAVSANSLRINLHSRNVFGPTVLATDAAGRVYTNISNTLYVLDETGALEDRIPLANLGLHGTILTDLLALPDGRLLVGGSGAQGIHACDLAQRRCAPFIQSGSQPVSAFKMAWDARRQRLVVVDGERHRILVYDRDGKLILESRGGDRGLKLPNTVLLAADDMALIADTNHHRLVWLDAETLSREYQEMAVGNVTGNFRRIWPTDFTATTDQHYWVILDNDLLENGDVRLFDTAGNPLQRLALPADWDPIKLRARPHDVLLAGYGSVDLVSISLDGSSISPFGDAAFRVRLAEVRAQRQASDRWWQYWIWMAIAPLVVLAVIAAWLDWKRRRATTPPVPGAVATSLPETGQGIYWLEPVPKVARLWRHSRWLLPVLAVLMIAPAVCVLWLLGPGKSAGPVGVMLCYCIVIMVLLATGIHTLRASRLGVTRDQVVLVAAGKPQRHFYPRQLVYSRHFLSSGDITVYLRTGKEPVYDPAETRSILEPLLASARRVNPFQGYIYLLQQGERLTWVGTLGLACLCGLYLYTEFFMG